MAEEQPGSLAGRLPELDFTVVELADRLLDRGAVVVGEAAISVAGVDLIYLGLNVLLTGVENMVKGPQTAGEPPLFTEEEIDHLRGMLPERVDVEPEGVEQGLAKLVLTLVEFLRVLLERQAVRRMEGGSLNDAEVERVGLALMRLEEKVREMARLFGLRPEDLNLDLGPMGRLL